MAMFMCDHCMQETRFLSLQNARSTAGVCRSTIYYWMERGWIHWRELPSGRRLICLNSLSRTGKPLGTVSSALPYVDGGLTLVVHSGRRAL
jgi:predicted DNA-binding transcriptional regulator AlpA